MCAVCDTPRKGCGYEQLIDLLRDVGFTEAIAFGNLEGDPYDEHARRLVIVAKK